MHVNEYRVFAPVFCQGVALSLAFHRSSRRTAAAAAAAAAQAVVYAQGGQRVFAFHALAARTRRLLSGAQPAAGVLVAAHEGTAPLPDAVLLELAAAFMARRRAH